jgi:signal peptidase II
MTRAQGWARALGTVVAVVVIDQVTKKIADGELDRGQSVNVFFGLDITNTRNKGVAFGALGGAATLIAILIAVALIVFIVRASRRIGSLGWAVALGLLLGGALGNLVDRVRGGGVIDFIDPALWPVFNLADVAIVVGVFGLLYVVDAQAKDK